MNATLVVLRKEVRESLRDRRILFNALVLGPLLGPLLFVVIVRLVVDREFDRAEHPLPVAVVGAAFAPNLIEALHQQGIEASEAPADPEAAVRAQGVDLVLRIPKSFDEDWRAGRPAQIEMIYDSSRREAGSQAERLHGALEAYARRTGAMRLMVRGLSPAVANPLLVARRDLATPQARGALLFSMLPYFVVLTAFLGGLFLAIDATAGERERQSLEPLLINPVPRWQILLGKVAATSAFSLVSVLLSLAAFALAGRALPAEQLGMSLDLGARLFVVVLPVMVPLVVLIAVCQTLVAAFAKGFREAQTYLGLLQLLPMIPSVLLSVLPFKVRLWMYSVPLVGQQLAIMRLLRGESVSLLEGGSCFLVTTLAAALAFDLARRIYNTEKLAISA